MKNISIKHRNAIASAFHEIKTLDDLSTLISEANKLLHEDPSPIKKQYLTWYAYHAKDKYTQFKIPKKNGSERIINAPEKRLKSILKPLNIILQCVHMPSSNVHGFVWNRSVATNASRHVGKNYVFNIDLENFFHSIHQARIWKRLQLPPFKLGGGKEPVARLIASLTCHDFGLEKNVLPQGAPTSPTITNIICEKLDRKLLGLAKRFNVQYTRYADDITFSSNHNVYQKDSDFITELERIVKEQGFTINPSKTRLQKRGYKQEVTGIIVNEKLNVPRHYIKQLRMSIHLLEQYGEEKAQEIFLQHYALDKGHVKNTEANMFSVISGKLNYLKMIKGENDPTYSKLNKRFIKICATEQKEDIIDKGEEANTPQKPKPLATRDKKLENNILCEHNPKALVEILKRFSLGESAFKVTCHSETYSNYDGYDDFMNALKNEWNTIKGDLKKYSSRLHGKISGFFFQEDLGEKNSEGYTKTWGENKIQIGWSSPKLAQWCRAGGNPFDYRLDENLHKEVNGKVIENFYDVAMSVFKNEIEIRTENHRLEKIFREFQKKLGSDFDVKLDGLRGKDFYTDVHWLNKALSLIFEEIKKRYTHREVTISAKQEEELEIRIVHVGSVPEKESSELLKETNDGDFEAIRNSLCSLCDWFIETKCPDGNYRLYYLKPEGSPDFEKLDNEPDGFTHILRFYK